MSRELTQTLSSNQHKKCDKNTKKLNELENRSEPIITCYNSRYELLIPFETLIHEFEMIICEMMIVSCMIFYNSNTMLSTVTKVRYVKKELIELLSFH